jgi:Lon-like protease
MPSAGDEVAADEALAEPATGGLARPVEPKPTRRRGLRIVIGIVVVLAAALLVAARWSVPYYAITPGHAFSISRLITVPHRQAHEHKGAVILTDVELTPLSALGYLYYEVRDRSAIISSADITGGQSNSAYNEEGVIDMATARQAATLVALRTLGYHVSAVPAGPVVYALKPGTSRALVPPIGSVIVGAAGTSTPTVADLRRVLLRHQASSVVLTYHMIGESKNTTRSYRLGLFYVEQTYRDANLPFRVRLSSGGIVGPSAGLSFTLGLIEELDGADLTGGKLVAATGTMSNDGSVGAVGGVAQKTRAVRSAGAEVFLVPPSGLQAARANAGAHLKIIAVSSIGQAVAALEGLGGRIAPTAHAGTS